MDLLKDLKDNEKKKQIHNTDDFKNELLISKEREIQVTATGFEPRTT